MTFLVSLLSDTQTQAAAAEALWTLSFNPEFKDTLQHNKEAILLLEGLTESSDHEVADKARGALFAINHQQPQAQTLKKGYDGGMKRGERREEKELFFSF